jgi:hypothetical protein
MESVHATAVGFKELYSLNGGDLNAWAQFALDYHWFGWLFPVGGATIVLTTFSRSVSNSVIGWTAGGFSLMALFGAFLWQMLIGWAFLSLLFHRGDVV